MKISRIIVNPFVHAVGLTVIALSLSLSPALAADTGTAAPGQNLLTNPGHEHPGSYFGGRGEINTAWNWVPFWEEPPAGVDLRDQNYRTPEFRPIFSYQYPYRVHSGGGSDRWFNYFALNKAAGVMQVVSNLPIGQPVRFSSWVELWSSNENIDPPKSTKDGNLQIRLCIQTDGGPRNMVSPNLKCGAWAQPYDKWVQLSIDATTISSTVLALIQSTASLPVEHNDAYADDSCFEVLPTANAKGICQDAGFIPTGTSVSTAPTTTAKTTPVTGAVTAPAGNDPLAAVLSAGINIREKPALTAKVVGGAVRRAVLTITGKSADGKWYQVKKGAITGWAFVSLLVPNKAAQGVAVVQ